MYFRSVLTVSASFEYPGPLETRQGKRLRKLAFANCSVGTILNLRLPRLR